MSGHSHVWRAARGVTLVELVVVMLLVAILGAVGYARLFDRQGFDLDSYTELSRSALRYAQKVAIAQNRFVYVFLDGGGVRLCFDKTLDCAASNQVLAPGGSNSASASTRSYCKNSNGWYCEAKPVAVTSTFSGPSNFLGFDRLGRPLDANGSADFNALTLVNSAGGESRTVTITGETGYVF